MQNPTNAEIIKKLSQEYRINFERFAFDCLKIRTKTKGLQPFVLNKAQLDFCEKIFHQLKIKGRIRAIVLKSRQMGFSTLIGAIIYWWIINHAGVKGLTLTHLDSATKELFEMTRRYYTNTPPFFVSTASNENRNELVFRSIDSALRTATAGSKNIAHGSTIQCLHWSEVSRSKNQAEMTEGVMQTVPSGDGSMIFLESTANGVGDYFHQTWEAAVRGESEFQPFFYAWNMMPEYALPATGFTFTEEERAYQSLHELTDDQLAWRQVKINEMEGSTYQAKLRRFNEQYPITPDEAFQSTGESMLNPDDVFKARKAEYEGVGATVMGIDPARRGRDFTGVVIRKGRRVEKALRLKVPDSMLVAERCADLIRQYRPDAVFVDTIGVGAGVFDRLKQMGFQKGLFEAIASATADDRNRYANKRAEMWDRLNEWLALGADIPDSDHFAADLLLPKCDYDSHDRLILESKKKMARSPDMADALAMTFYLKNIQPQGGDETYRRAITGGGSMLDGRV